MSSHPLLTTSQCFTLHTFYFLQQAKREVIYFWNEKLSNTKSSGYFLKYFKLQASNTIKIHLIILWTFYLSWVIPGAPQSLLLALCLEVLRPYVVHGISASQRKTLNSCIASWSYHYSGFVKYNTCGSEHIVREFKI